MKKHLPITLIALLVLGGASACATKGYVNTNVDDRAKRVERRVNEVERTLEDTTVGTGRNAARIREVDDTATNALDTANSAVESSRAAQTTATDARNRAGTLETASRRLLFEVILAADHGQFGFADATLPKPASAQLDGLVNRLHGQAAVTYIEIEGHTDASGPPAFNKRLGLARAESVRRYLHEQHHLPLHKISVISYGEEKPVAPNETLEGRAKNRRVVVRVLG